VATLCDTATSARADFDLMCAFPGNRERGRNERLRINEVASSIRQTFSVSSNDPTRNLATLYGATDDGAPAIALPKLVKKELEGYLDCGRRCRDFAAPLAARGACRILTWEYQCLQSSSRSRCPRRP